jgi:flagellar hook-associated protein 3 FlgL
MRVTGNRLIDLAAKSTVDAQSNLATISNQVTSGKRVSTPTDDPTAWVEAQRVKLRQAMSQGTGAAVTANRAALTQTDSSLSQIGDVLSSVRTLAVQGASDSYDSAGRAGLATQVQGLFQTALNSANVQGNDGAYLLGGSQSSTAPFAADGTYAGDADQRAVAANGSSTNIGNISISGSSLTASNGVDVLPLINKVATALASNDQAGLQALLPDLTTAIKQVATTRTQTGGAINVLDAATSARGDLEANMTTAISNYTEVDTISAASSMAQASQALQVSQAVSSKLIQILSPAATAA